MHLVAVLLLLVVAREAATSELCGSSTSSFSLARELAHGTDSIIVVPRNHSVAGEFNEKGERLQLTRWGRNLAWHLLCQTSSSIMTIFITASHLHSSQQMHLLHSIIFFTHRLAAYKQLINFQCIQSARAQCSACFMCLALLSLSSSKNSGLKQGSLPKLHLPS
jgi:hypothetical protein